MIPTKQELKEAARQFIDELTDEVLETRRRTEIYLTARIRGTTPRMALMFACQQAPAERTSDQWWRGNRHFSETMGSQYAERVRKALSKQGYEMSPWDDYDPGSAKFLGDKDAVISGHASPRERLIRAQQLLAEKQARDENAPRVQMAEDLIAEKFEAIATEHPEVRKAPAREKKKIREQIIDKHAYDPD